MVDMVDKAEQAFLEKKPVIPHYYGDTVRLMFLSSGVIYALSMALIGNVLPVDVYTGIILILILAFLAGITSPHNRWLMLINATVAGMGVYLVQSAAITFFTTDSPFLFIVRQTIALLLLFGFYYSVKSFRSMLAGNIGKTAKPGEFENK